VASGRVLLALVALMALGCAVEGDFGGSEFLCADGRCPSGFTCVVGVCRSELDEPACGSLSALQDDFDDGVVDPELWSPFADDGTVVEESAGRLRISLEGNPAGTGGGYDGLQIYELPGTFTIEVVSAEVGAPNALFLQLFGASSSGRFVSLVRTANLLLVNSDAGNGFSEPWTPDSYWLRLDGREGRMFAQWSSDGGNFEALADVEFDEPAVRPVLGLSSEPGDTGTSSVVLDNVGLPPTTARVDCD
jgi:hypothetical protein